MSVSLTINLSFSHFLSPSIFIYFCLPFSLRVFLYFFLFSFLSFPSSYPLSFFLSSYLPFSLFFIQFFFLSSFHSISLSFFLLFFHSVWNLSWTTEFRLFQAENFSDVLLYYVSALQRIFILSMSLPLILTVSKE